MKGVGGVGPPLHQSVKGLVVSVPLSVRQSEDEVLKPDILNLVLDVIEKFIVPRVSSVEIPSTFEGVGIMLQNELESYVSRNRELFKTCKIIFRNPAEEATPLHKEAIVSLKLKGRSFLVKG